MVVINKPKRPRREKQIRQVKQDKGAKVRVNVLLPIDLYNRLKDLVAKTKRGGQVESLSLMIAKCIDNGLNIIENGGVYVSSEESGGGEDVDFEEQKRLMVESLREAFEEAVGNDIVKDLKKLTATIESDHELFYATAMVGDVSERERVGRIALLSRLRRERLSELGDG